MAKSDPVCAYCEKPGELSRDHVVPRSRGGPDNATNIVMACKSCNSSKGDRLASEWLGERCPQPVLLIEARVNAKLKAVFKQRNQGKAEPPRVYGFNQSPDGVVHFIGEVVSEGPDWIRLAVIDALLFIGAGVWEFSGELRDVPRAECRLFLDLESCAERAAQKIAERRNGE